MKPLLICVMGLGLVATTLSPATARGRYHRRHHGLAHQDVYTPDQATGRTYDIVAGSNKVRINSVGQVITNRHP